MHPNKVKKVAIRNASGRSKLQSTKQTFELEMQVICDSGLYYLGETSASPERKMIATSGS